MIKNYELLTKKIAELEKQAEQIQKRGIKILEVATLEQWSSHFSLKKFDYKNEKAEEQRDVARKYQIWYASSLTLVEEYTPQWSESFQSYYTRKNPNVFDNGVINYIDLNVYSAKPKDFELDIKQIIINNFISSFEKQISILLSIPSIIQTKEMSLRKTIAADFAKTEIEEAETLQAGKHYRAAGTIAGVALELHLKTMCDINAIDYSPKATLDPLAQALYKNNQIDITELKHIQYLAAIRNKCAHPNAVSEEEIKKLIEEVKKLI